MKNDRLFPVLAVVILCGVITGLLTASPKSAPADASFAHTPVPAATATSGS